MTSDIRPLPFTISLAKTAQDVLEVVEHRSRGYGRRSAALGSALSMPEPWDARAPGREILMARSKLDGKLIGSMRVFIHDHELFSIDAALDVPAPFKGKRTLTAARFCSPGGPACRSALFKGAMAFGRLHGAECFVIGSLPSIAPIYEHVGFRDVFEDGYMFPIASAENLPHRIMALSLSPDAETQSGRPAISAFLLADHGRDIDVTDALRGDFPVS